MAGFAGFEGFDFKQPEQVAAEFHQGIQRALTSGNKDALRAAVAQQAAFAVSGGSPEYKKAVKAKKLLIEAGEQSLKNSTGDEVQDQINFYKTAQRAAVEAGLPEIALQATENITQMSLLQEDRARLRSADARETKKFEEYLEDEREEDQATRRDRRQALAQTGLNAYRNTLKEFPGDTTRAEQDATKAQLVYLSSETAGGTIADGTKRARDLGIDLGERFDPELAESLTQSVVPELKTLTTVMGEDGVPKLAYVVNTPNGPEIQPTDFVDAKTLARLASAEATTDSKVTDSQRNAATYAVQVNQAQAVFDDLDNAEVYFTGVGDRIEKNFLNGMKSDDRQKYEQATANFVQSYLRDVSGATIKGEEIELDTNRFIPQPGDSREMVKQKAANRRAYQAGLMAQAGDKAYSEATRILGVLTRQAEWNAKLADRGY